MHQNKILFNQNVKIDTDSDSSINKTSTHEYSVMIVMAILALLLSGCSTSPVIPPSDGQICSIKGMIDSTGNLSPYLLYINSDGDLVNPYLDGALVNTHNDDEKEDQKQLERS